MNTFSKILFTTLPLLVLSLVSAVGTTYYFTDKALNDLAEAWLRTRLTEALQVVEEQKDVLDKYGLQDIPASVAKAELDASTEMSGIEIGEQGYIMVLNTSGVIAVHPDKSFIGKDMSGEDWFREVRAKTKGRVRIPSMGGNSLARYELYKPWGWYVMAVDPESEVYGAAKRIKPYIFILGIFLLILTAFFLLLMTRRLTAPLKHLAQGAERIGEGDFGTRIPVESQDEFGRLAGVFNLMAGQLEESLASLRHSEEKFRGIFENAIEGIYRTTPDGRLIEANPAMAKTLGYASPDELLSAATDVAEQYYVNPEDRKELLRIVSERGWVSGFENQNRKRDGTRIWTTTNMRAIRDSKGEVIYLEGSYLDITERKEKEKAEREREAARAASRAKSTFLATMSHEIRTPMNAILGLSEMLSESSLNPEQKKYVKILEDSCENLLHLINQVLDLSKVESGQLELDSVPFDLGDLLARICEVMPIKGHEKKLRLTCHVNPQTPANLIGDPTRLRQILDNLIENAFKFTHEGEIQVGCEIPAWGSPKNGEILFWVRDTGVGIPKEKQRKIFENFSQADASTTREYGGTGLGLAICKRLTEMMGGRIWVESPVGMGLIESSGQGAQGGASRTVNPGSRFCFTARFGLQDTGSLAEPRLPEAKTHDRLVPDVQAQVAACQERRKIRSLRILLVEDNKNNAMLFSFYLQNTPHQVDIAVNGREGVEMYVDGEYDIIFMDMAMPVMDGYDATRAIRKCEKAENVPPVPIIALTAHALEGTEQKSLDAGCTLHMTKPIKKTRLLQILERFCPNERATVS